MLHIPPIQSGTSAAPGHALTPASSSPGQQVGGAALGQTAGIGGGNVANVVSEVAEMLRNIGGGVQNNRALQAIIALLILVALLQAAQGNQQAGQSGLELLDTLGGRTAGSGQDGSSMSLYFEQTTVSITSTTFVASFGSAQTADGSLGQQVDQSV